MELRGHKVMPCLLPSFLPIFLQIIFTLPYFIFRFILVSGGEDGKVRVWSRSSGDLLDVLDHHTYIGRSSYDPREIIEIYLIIMHI